MEAYPPGVAVGRRDDQSVLVCALSIQRLPQKKKANTGGGKRGHYCTHTMMKHSEARQVNTLDASRRHSGAALWSLFTARWERYVKHV